MNLLQSGNVGCGYIDEIFLNHILTMQLDQGITNSVFTVVNQFETHYFSVAKTSFYGFPCYENGEKIPNGITCCVFDTTGKRVACCFGDHRILVLKQRSESNRIQEWDRATYTVSTKATIIQIDWNVITLVAHFLSKSNN